MDQLIQELEKSRKRQKLAHGKILDTLDGLVDKIQNFRDDIEDMDMDDENTATLDGKVEKFCKVMSSSNPTKVILGNHKDYFSGLSKFGKTIDKQFTTSLVPPLSDRPLRADLVNPVIARHFYREGRFKLADNFCESAGVLMGESIKKPFVELHQIIEDLRKGWLNSAIRWAERNRTRLNEMRSPIHFELHKQFYLSLLREGKIVDALKHARTHFSQFSKTRSGELQRLMGCMSYAKRLDTSPYADLFSQEATERNITQLFIKEYCKLQGLAHESVLYTSVAAGSLALPKLLKVISILSSKTDWKDRKELPIEIDLGKDFHFHSIFICPVSRELATNENPPVLLPCGHVISRQSMLRMTRNSSRSRLKCPTCPIESTLGQTKEITF